MSLYNMLFGENVLADIWLTLLGTERHQIPRYRDVLLKDGEVVIHTRTGGGNRDYYESAERRKWNNPEADTDGPFNEDLRKLPGYLRDEDDSFDSTYANFFYAVPEAVKKFMTEHPVESKMPAEKWRDLLTALEKGEKTPTALRALEVGEKIFEQLKNLPSGTIVKI